MSEAPIHRRISRVAAVGLALAVCAGPSAAQDWKTISSSRRVAGERALEVDVEYGAGQLTVRPGSSGLLYDATMRYDAGMFDPSVRYAAGRLSVDMEGSELRGGNHEPGSLELALSPSVPLEIDLKFGAGRAEVELGGLRLRRASIATGASETQVRFSSPNTAEAEALEVQVGAARFEMSGIGNAYARRLDVEGGVGEIVLDFSGRWRRDLDVDVEMGLGSLRLVLPRGLGVRVRKSGLLASFDSQRFTKRGEDYYSEGWEKAEHKLMLDIDAAFSSIEVRWVDDPSFAP